MAPNYTSQEDAALWRYAIEHGAEGGLNMWKKFQTSTGSNRDPRSIYHRFHEVLLIHLPRTHFHVVNKIKLCMWFAVPVNGAFRESLSVLTDLEVSSDAIIVDYVLKQTAPKNEDLQLGAADFMLLTEPIENRNRNFTAEEERLMWVFVSENVDHYKPKDAFWKPLSFVLDRQSRVLANKFKQFGLSELDQFDCCSIMKQKIQLKCEIPVPSTYKKKLSHENSAKDASELNDKARRKRKTDGEKAGEVKRSRMVHTDASEQAVHDNGVLSRGMFLTMYNNLAAKSNGPDADHTKQWFDAAVKKLSREDDEPISPAAAQALFDFGAIILGK